jgi:hypothetical protein
MTHRMMSADIDVEAIFNIVEYSRCYKVLTLLGIALLVPAGFYGRKCAFQ